MNDEQHILCKIRQLLSYMSLEELLFRAKLEAWRHKMFHIFHLLQCEMVLRIVNPFREYFIPSPMRKDA